MNIFKPSILTTTLLLGILYMSEGFSNTEVKKSQQTDLHSDSMDDFKLEETINVLDNIEGNIARATIEYNDVESMQLFFSDIILPKGAYIEISNSDRTKIFQYGFQDFKLNTKNNKHQFTAPAIEGNNAIIKVIYTGSAKYSDNDRVVVESYSLKDSFKRAIFGNDERVPSICLKDTINDGLYKRSRSVGVFSWRCSTWAFSPDNYMLTNQHCARSESAISGGNVTFNYLSDKCSSKETPSDSVTFKGGKMLTTGNGGYTDYTLYTIDDFDYINAKVKYFFGGLHINETKTTIGTPTYIPQHGNGGIMPQKIAYLDNRDPSGKCKVANNPREVKYYTCDTQPGSSGSPVLSGEDHSVIALHYASGGSYNIGVSSDYLWNYISPYIDQTTENKEVLGTDILRSSTVDIVGNSKYEMIIKNFTAEDKFLPFSDTSIVHYTNHSTIKVKTKSNITGNIFYLKYRLQKHTLCGTGNLLSTCHLINGDFKSRITLHYSPEDNLTNTESLQGTYSWIPLEFQSLSRNRKEGLLIKVINNYDSPNVKIVDEVVFKNTKETYKSKNFGQKTPFSTVAFLVAPSLSANIVDGPTKKVWETTSGPSKITVQCPFSNKQIIINAYRQRDNGRKIIMNSGVHAGSPDSSLVLSLAPNQLTTCTTDFMIKAEGWHDKSIEKYIHVSILG
ncbi:trypsin-like peptidase domain-containing protein [Francisellaceae bacterium CB300]